MLTEPTFDRPGWLTFRKALPRCRRTRSGVQRTFVSLLPVFKPAEESELRLSQPNCQRANQFSAFTTASQQLRPSLLILWILGRASTPTAKDFFPAHICSHNPLPTNGLRIAENLAKCGDIRIVIGRLAGNAAVHQARRAEMWQPRATPWVAGHASERLALKGAKSGCTRAYCALSGLELPWFPPTQGVALGCRIGAFQAQGTQ